VTETFCASIPFLPCWVSKSTRCPSASSR
jgi:hypothetical protein